MKKKYIDGSNWNWVDKYTSMVTHIDDVFCGFISFVKIHKVHEKLFVDYGNAEICLFDDGYKCLIFLPDNQNWCVSAVYDDLGKIVEWYFDITKENSIDEQGNPFFMDLYLDIAVSANNKIRILDEDELNEALSSGDITKIDFDMAYMTCYELIKNVIPREDFLVSFFNRYLSLFDV
jgi:predicted RNA-binding protein associated with RNAse of E/G family